MFFGIFEQPKAMVSLKAYLKAWTLWTDPSIDHPMSTMKGPELSILTPKHQKKKGTLADYKWTSIDQPRCDRKIRLRFPPEIFLNSGCSPPASLSHRGGHDQRHGPYTTRWRWRSHG